MLKLTPAFAAIIDHDDVNAMKLWLEDDDNRLQAGLWFPTIRAGATRLAELFLNCGMDANVSGAPRRPLHMAAEFGNSKIVRLLLAHNADPNQSDGLDEGMTPIECSAHFAPDENRDEIIELLRSSGTYITFRVAVQIGDIERVCTALDEDTGLLGDSWCLMMACRCGQLQVVSELVRRGADVNATWENGNFPLWFACNRKREGRVPLARLLVERGADVNQVGEDGQTPLHQAAVWNNADMVEFLVEQGAISNIRDAHGLTPFDYALRIKNPEIQTLLRAKISQPML